MTTSEPTTGEIVRALRVCASIEAGVNCDACPYDKDECDGTCIDKLESSAADRLESQENEIEELKAEAIVNALENAERIANLTTRAEQAEAREQAAVADMHGYCQFCGGYDREEDEEPCNTCTNARTFEPDDVERTDNWEYRGLPQDGEGK